VGCWAMGWWAILGHRRGDAFAIRGWDLIESGERRLDVVEFVVVARALKVDQIELFTRVVRAF